MFDIGFGELALVMVIGLVVLGPERLPVAVRTVAGWIRTLRSLASTVQNELAQELKLQELQNSLKKVEQSGLQNLSPELKASMDELKAAAESMKKSYHSSLSVNEPEAIDDAAHQQVLQSEPHVIAEHSSASQVSESITGSKSDPAPRPIVSRDN